jgi:ATP-dependent RNA helicase DHX36
MVAKLKLLVTLKLKYLFNTQLYLNRKIEILILLFCQQKNAERVACRHAILKLNQSGQLREILYGGIHPAALDKDLLSQEQDAKLDIYDYCARYDTVPEYVCKDITRSGTRKALIEVTVQMPQQGIIATARATDRRVAEILASVEFKRQAEEWHAKHGDEDILVKDVASVINSRNAKKFFEFFKIHNPGAVYQFQATQLKSSGRSKRVTGSMMEGRVYLNDQPIGEPVEMGAKKQAEAAAWVTAAVALKEAHPTLFPRFIEALRMGNGEILKPIPPSWLNIEQDCIIAMTDTLLSVRRIGLPPTEEQMNIEDSQAAEQRRRSTRRRLDRALAKAKSQKMLESYEEYMKDKKLDVLRQKRSELPMNQYTNHVLDLVNGHDVSIIVGATGSGKTSKLYSQSVIIFFEFS